MGLPINESIPRVPEPHAEISIEDEKLLSDLYIRTSWFDAALALDQIEKVSTRHFRERSQNMNDHKNEDANKKKKCVKWKDVCAVKECC